MKISVIFVVTLASLVTGFPNKLLAEKRSGDESLLGDAVSASDSLIQNANHVAADVVEAVVPGVERVVKRSVPEQNAATTAASNAVLANDHEGGRAITQSNSIASVVNNHGGGYPEHGAVAQSAAMAQSSMLGGHDGYPKGYRSTPESGGPAISSFTSALASSMLSGNPGSYLNQYVDSNAIGSIKSDGYSPVDSSVSSITETIVSSNPNDHGVDHNSGAMSGAEVTIVSEHNPYTPKNEYNPSRSPAPQSYYPYEGRPRYSPEPSPPPSVARKSDRFDNNYDSKPEGKVVKGYLVIPWVQEVEKRSTFVPETRMGDDEERDRRRHRNSSQRPRKSGSFDLFSDELSSRIYEMFRSRFSSYNDIFSKPNSSPYGPSKHGDSSATALSNAKSSIFDEDDGYGGWSNSNAFANSANEHGIASAIANSISSANKDGKGSSSASAAAAAAASAKDGIATASASAAASTAFDDGDGDFFGSGISHGFAAGDDAQAGSSAGSRSGNGTASTDASAIASAGGVSAGAGAGSSARQRRRRKDVHKRETDSTELGAWSNALAGVSNLSGRRNANAASNANAQVIGKNYGLDSLQAHANSFAFVDNEDIDGLWNSQALSQSSALVSNDKEYGRRASNPAPPARPSNPNVNNKNEPAEANYQQEPKSQSPTDFSDFREGNNKSWRRRRSAGNAISLLANTNSNVMQSGDGAGKTSGSALSNAQVSANQIGGIEGLMNIQAIANSLSSANFGGGHENGAFGNALSKASTLIQSQRDAHKNELNIGANSVSTTNGAGKGGSGAGSAAASSALSSKVTKDGKRILSASSAAAASAATAGAGKNGGSTSIANSAAQLASREAPKEEAPVEIKEKVADARRQKRNLDNFMSLFSNTNAKASSDGGSGTSNAKTYTNMYEDLLNGAFNMEAGSNSAAQVNSDKEDGSGGSGTATTNTLVSMQNSGNDKDGSSTSIKANSLSSAKVVGKGSASAAASSAVSLSRGKDGKIAAAGSSGGAAAAASKSAAPGKGFDSSTAISNVALTMKNIHSRRNVLKPRNKRRRHAKKGRKHRRRIHKRDVNSDDSIFSAIGQAISSAGITIDSQEDQYVSSANSAANAAISNKGDRKGLNAQVASNSIAQILQNGLGNSKSSSVAKSLASVLIQNDNKDPSKSGSVNAIASALTESKSNILDGKVFGLAQSNAATNMAARHKRDTNESILSLIAQAVSSAGINNEEGDGKSSISANSLANALVNSKGHGIKSSIRASAESAAATQLKGSGTRESSTRTNSLASVLLQNKQDDQELSGLANALTKTETQGNGLHGQVLTSAQSQAIANILGRHRRDLFSSIGQASSAAGVKGDILNGDFLATADSVAKVALNGHAEHGSNLLATANSAVAVKSHPSSANKHNLATIVANTAANSGIKFEHV